MMHVIRLVVVMSRIIILNAELAQEMPQGAQRADEYVADEAVTRTNRRISGEPIEMKLTPEESTSIIEGDDLTFQCKIKNKPPYSQLQWYYILRDSDGTLANFTIIANEVATVDSQKYRVSATPPNIYTLKVNYFEDKDSGEYCCFLYVSPTEAYRQAVNILVLRKYPPTTSRPAQLEFEDPRKRLAQGKEITSLSKGKEAGSATSPEVIAKENEIEEAIEEAVTLDVEQEIGRRLNITLMKHNSQTQTLIQNATDQIRSMFNVDDTDETEFRNETTRRTIKKKIKGMTGQVRTVVSSLIGSVTDINSTLSQASTSLLQQIKNRNSPETAPRQGVNSDTDKEVEWRKLYEEYKKGADRGASKADKREWTLSRLPSERSENHSPPTSSPLRHALEDEELERQEEQSNRVDHHPSISDRPQKCEYRLIVNEFDPSQCPSINSGAAAAMYYQSRPTEPHDSAVSEQIVKLERMLMDELVNTKVVNKTVNMHDSMLSETEQKLQAQTSNLTKMEATLRQLEDELRKQVSLNRNMDEKLASVMLNIYEVNARLDTAMSPKYPNGKDNDKPTPVQSAAEQNQCDKHTTVKHYLDCDDVASAGNKISGVYYIKPIYSSCPIPAWCDLDTYPGGWLVIQRRQSGEVSFTKEWKDYRQGFGNVTSEHWLGNDNIFLLSNQREYMLRVDLWDFFDSRVYAEYRVFKIEGERDGFRLQVSNYSGTAGNGLKTHNMQKFSTADKDNDQWSDYNCAHDWEGGWWFTNCWSSYLNGPYYNSSNPPYQGIAWREWKDDQLLRSEMKIRPVFHTLTPQVPAEESQPAKGGETDKHGSEDKDRKGDRKAVQQDQLSAHDQSAGNYMGSRRNTRHRAAHVGRR